MNPFFPEALTGLRWMVSQRSLCLCCLGGMAVGSMEHGLSLTSEWGCSPVEVCRLLSAVGFLVAEQRL